MEEKNKKNLIIRVREWVKGKFASSEGYISGKESRRIDKENRATVKRLERYKKRRGTDESEYLSQMKNPENVVEFDNLRTYFFTDSGVVKAVDGVTFDVPQNSIIGIVGESGCGKSISALSLMQLVQAPQGQIVGGEIRFRSNSYARDEKGNFIPVYKEGEEGAERIQAKDENGLPMFVRQDKVYDITKMPLKEMNKIRGRDVAMIFQEPMTSLNPVFTIGNQLDEITLLHVPNATKQSARERSIEMLQLVGIAMPENVCKRYPHELSGGMRQRVMIAMAIACNPKLIIADEPTTALDVTIQAQILDLLREIKEKINGSIMLITHDLGVIAEMADVVVVMYAGRIIEMGTVEEIFDSPKHPYTVGLQKSKPQVNKTVDKLHSIPGQVPSPVNMPSHCYFKDRCNRCFGKCSQEYPPVIQVSPTHSVACYLYDKNNELTNDNASKRLDDLLKNLSV